MSIITKSVTNLLTYSITLPIPGYDANHPPVVVPASSTLDLLTVLTEDELEAIQPTLALLVRDNSLSVAATVDTTMFDYVDTSKLVDWVISTDILIQFAPINGDMVQNSYNVSLSSRPFSVALWVTNGSGILDTFNNTETVTVNATGGTVNGSSNATVTVHNGIAVLTIDRTIAGDTSLSLSDNTRLGISDTAVIHWS